MIAFAWQRRDNNRAAEPAPHCQFAGWLDNAEEIARQLVQPAPAWNDFAELGRIYHAAVQHWGEGADRKLIGEYAAALFDPERRTLRLSRSPLRAPPLHYHASRERVIASTRRDVLFAAGVARQLDYSKLADQAMFNLTGEEQDWYLGIARVPLGAVVEFTPERHAVRKYYDIAALPRLRPINRADALAEARHLFDQATQAALVGSRKPAVMLSGGLDSALVATAALRTLAADQTLAAHTFAIDPGWSGHIDPDRYADERTLVEALCAQHPRIVPQFHDRAASQFDTGIAQLVSAIGSSPINLPNLAPYHAMWRAAAESGCDRILLGEFGNITLSAAGDWAFAEYFAKIQWGQLTRALRHSLRDSRPLWRRFVGNALLPFLPDQLWHWQRRLRGAESIFVAASPLRKDFALASGALERARTAGAPDPRHPRRTRLPELLAAHREASGEFSDVYHGFERLYGMQQRDPTAWRPLFEFCAGLPSSFYLHDGQRRWLARELGKGDLPDAIRLNPRRGLHDPGWYNRLADRRTQLIEELAHWQRVPHLAEMFDLAGLRADLQDWPPSDRIDPYRQHRLSSAVPRAILLARFVAHVENLAPLVPNSA